MNYHHGDLKRTLLITLPALIEEQGLEKLSLRALARRAGVSHGAPAHHFGDKRGLLTAFAIEGSRYLAALVVECLETVHKEQHAERLTQVGLGYLEFALKYPAHFRVSFRPELLNILDPELASARAEAGGTLDAVLRAAEADGWLASAVYPEVRMASWALAHGYAALTVDVFAGAPADALRKQARAAFLHYSQSVLQKPKH